MLSMLHVPVPHGRCGQYVNKRVPRRLLECMLLPLPPLQLWLSKGPGFEGFTGSGVHASYPAQQCKLQGGSEGHRCTSVVLTVDGHRTTWGVGIGLVRSPPDLWSPGEWGDRLRLLRTHCRFQTAGETLGNHKHEKRPWSLPTLQHCERLCRSPPNPTR